MTISPTNIDNSLNSFNLINSKLDALKNTNSSSNAKNLSDDEKKKIEQSARGFESMFVNMMMKQMKEAMLEDDDAEEGEMNFGADTLKSYGDMLFGDYVSKSGKGIGLGEMIYKQLTGEESFPLITNEINREKNLTITQPIAPKEISNNIINNQKSIIDSLNQNTVSRITNYDEIIKKAANKFGIDENLVKAIITVESAGKNEAKSNSGAKGLMQLMDGTAKDLGVSNSFDPYQNIMGGTKYIAQMLEKYDNNLNKALAAYNAGPGNVDKYNGIPPFKETQQYVKRVNHYLNQFSHSSSIAKSE